VRDKGRWIVQIHTSQALETEVLYICGGIIVVCGAIVVLDEMYYVEDGEHTGEL
jgi:hypothetical protein